jgi:integrase
MAKRASGEGMIRQRPDGLWEGRIRIDGKRPTVYGKTEKEVRDKLLAMRRNVSEGRPALPDRMTTGEFLDRWLTDAVRVKNDAKTIRDYERIVRVHINPTFGKTPLKSLSSPDVQRWINRLGSQPMKKGRGGAPLSSRSIHYYRATFRAALNQAAAWKLIPSNPVEATEGPKQRKKRVVAMERETARAILAAFESDHLEAFVTMLLTTGIRPGEALGLRWSDVDLTNGTMKIQTGRSGGLKRESAWRELVLPDVVINQLRAMERWSVLVFPDRDGGHRDETTVLHQF